MKKIVLAMMATLTLSMSVMAQDGQIGASRPERRQMDPKEMIQRRTDFTVQQYGLNEEQAKKLLELNTKYPNMMMGGQRGQRGGQRGMMGQGRPRRGEAAPNDTARRQRPEMGNPEQMKARMEEMKKQREAYDAELKTIMTEEQFKAYTADMEKRMQGQGGPGGRRQFNGQRPRRENQ